MRHHAFIRSAAGITSLALILAQSGLLPAGAAASGVTINEVCSKNTTYKAPDGGLYDWVELYNAATSAADLSGWGLSDKEAKPFKYTFPDGTSIPAGGRLVVFCDSTAAVNDPSIAAFGLSGSGETLTLTNKDGAAVDTLTFGGITADASYGQYPDGSGEFFEIPCTPGDANRAPEGENAVAQPEFSKDSGFYDSSFSLTLTAASGLTIYYTTDGSDPTTASEKYTGPITIEDMTNTPNRLSAKTDISASGAEAPKEGVLKAAVIRAAAVDASGNISKPVTKTYFVGKTNSGYFKEMKVVSLVTDPDNLFDYEKGIYCLGKVYDDENGSSSSDPGQGPGWPGGGWPGGGGGWGFKQPWEMDANYTQKGREWEREANFELFENGQKILSQGVGIRIKGGASRSNPQKSFNVYARRDYDLPEFSYDFFDGTAVKAKNGKVIDKFESIVLRDGGNDSRAAFFRDSINQKLVADRSFATQAMSECIVFIDGEFWGVYQITEKISDDTLKSHYGVTKSDVAIIKNSELEEGEQADLDEWNALVKGVGDGSVSYKQLGEKMDMQSFMDYFAAQIYWANADWPNNNTALWRTDTVDASNPYADGRWRMFLFDTEYSTGLYGGMQNTSASTDVFSKMSGNGGGMFMPQQPESDDPDLGKMFTTLLKDTQFQKDFSATMMDMINYNFTQERTESLISFYKNTYSQQILDTYERFYSESLSGSKGQSNLEQEYAAVQSFYQQRPEQLERQLKSAAGLKTDLQTLTIQNDKNSGAVTLNTLKLGDIDTWSGKYHMDYDLPLTAVPKDGCTFSRWEITGAEITEGTAADTSIRIQLTGDATIKAVYTNSPQPPAVVGDYNGDGTANVQDVVILQKYLLGLKVKLNDTDMVKDGVTDIFDLAALKRFLLNK